MPRKGRGGLGNKVGRGGGKGSEDEDDSSAARANGTEEPANVAEGNRVAVKSERNNFSFSFFSTITILRFLCLK